MPDYAGDLSPLEAWRLLEDTPNATLVDVRTQAEWAWVGVPYLGGIGREPILVEWVRFPTMQPNPSFVQDVIDTCPDKNAPIVFLCRSGVRSRGAAAALTDAGYTKAYNILEGFEGDKDSDNHRGQVGGWKVAGLPWVQG